MKFTEAKLEAAITHLLETQGYPHIKGDTLTNRSPQEVLITDDLRQFLSQKYQADNLTTAEIDSIIRKLEVLSASDLYASNKTIMTWVSDGFTFKRDDRSQKDLYIHFIDYSDSDLNHYKFVTQMEIVGYEKRIPDGVLYINGLPLVVFEFKSAIREETTLHEAYVQLTTRYKRDIPELFKYNGSSYKISRLNSHKKKLFF